MSAVIIVAYLVIGAVVATAALSFAGIRGLKLADRESDRIIALAEYHKVSIQVPGGR